MIGLVIAFLCGVLFAVFLAFVGAVAWAYSQPVLPPKPKGFVPYSKPKLPKSLEEVYGYVNGPDGSTEVKVESCNWFNLIVDFIFREMRDSPEVKRFVMKKISREFTELMLNKTEGKMIEQLTVRDYSFGTSLPVLSRVTILKIECSDDEGKEPVEIDLSVDLDYSGGFRLAIDADLVFNKSAYVSIQILKVKGQGRLHFTLLPFTHWSLSFFEDPEVQLKVKSQLGGRHFPQLSSFIERQIRKWVKRKYTLPASKVRYKPFFRQYKPQNQLLDVYVHDHSVTGGGLKVKVVECTRLREVEGATKIYCTLCVAPTPCQAQLGLWRATWPVHEFSVRKKENQSNTIGILHKVPCDDYPDLVLVYMVPAGSSALAAGIKEGDVLTKVNRIKVTSVKQASRLLQRTKDNSILVSVQRPPSHFTAELLRRGAVETTDSGPPASSRDGNQRGTVETDGGEPATSEGKKEQPAPLKKAPKPSQTPVYSHSKSFADQYGRAACTFLPGDLDSFVASEDYSSYSPKPARSHPKPPLLRQPDEDSVSLCGVTGERELETARRRHLGLGRKRPRAPVNTPTEEPDTLTSLNGAATVGYAAPPSPVPAHPLLPTQPSGEDGVDSTDFGRVEGGRTDGCCDGDAGRVQTSETAACKHPIWDEQFEFDLKKEHHYLNVCVWARLAEGRKSLLVGYVTISLMDIALECVSTSSGTHHQRYALVAKQSAKATASRAALQATPSSARPGPGTDDPPFVGDIFLRFWHTPAALDEAEEEEEVLEREASEQSDTAEVEADSPTMRFTQRHPFTAELGHLPSDHDFVIIKNVGDKCDICYKKVWGKKVRKCTHCKLKCHRKCALYCEREVPCYRRGSDASSRVSLDHLRERNDNDYVVYSSDDEDSDMENGNRHRRLEQTPEPDSLHGQCEEAEDSDDSFKNSDLLRAMADGDRDRLPSDDTLGSPKVPRLYNILREGLSSEGEVEMVDGAGDAGTAAISGTAVPGDKKDDSRSEDRATAACAPGPAHPFLAPLLEGDSSDSEPDLEQRKLLEELCHALYRDLPPPERRANLKQKIRSLQSEINYISDLINATAQELSSPGLSPLQEERIREQMDRDEGKLQPLRLLMKQYVMALEYCPESKQS